MTRRVSPNKYLIDLRWTENGRRRRRRITVLGSAKDAERYESRLKAEMKAGQLVAQQENSDIPTFEVFSDTWFQSYVVPTNKPSEQDNKRIFLKKHLIPFFGNCRLDKINHYIIEQFIAQQVAKGYAPASTNLHLSTLKRALKSAVEWSILKKNPADTIKKLKNEAESWQFLDFDESEAFLNAVPAKWKTLFLVAIRTGLRKGELCALRWRDVDWANQAIHVRHSLYKGELTSPKSKDSIRTVPLPTDAREALQEHREREQSFKTEFVFPSSTGGPLEPRTLQRPLRTANKNSGFEKQLRFHDTRHTYASHLVMAGVPIRTVKDLLGHSSLDQTLRYAHITGETHREAVKALEATLKTKRRNSRLTQFPREK